jgi:hypothetical protein
MPPTLRRILAVAGALVVAFAIVYAIEAIAGRMTPIPAGIDTTDPVALKTALEAGEVPFPSLFLVFAGWLLAAYVGGGLAWRWSEEGTSVWTFAVVFTGVVVWTLTLLPHPTWMWIGGVGGTLLFALGGGRRHLSISARPQ